MIDVKHLSKSFGDHLVLKDISEHIYPGDKMVIIGPSGSGKSTFLRSLNLLEEPTSGTITFDGEVITDPKTDIDVVRRKMGMVFQHFNLFPNMTIRKNITLAPVRTGLMTQAEADDKATQLLRRVSLEEKADAYPNQLSGGQKQRISIARVFLKNPPILILDEATSALDNESERLVQQSLEKLAKGRTVFTIAHRLTTIRGADTIWVLTDKGVEEQGSHSELMKKGGLYAHLYEMYTDKGETEA